jgi:hypothetical protein
MAHSVFLIDKSRRIAMLFVVKKRLKGDERFVKVDD